MGRQGTTVRINPGVFRWAVEGSGWDVEELSEETNIKSEHILRWKRNSTAISVSDLRRISKTIKRPLSVLLLPEPPKEGRLPDYRRSGGAHSGKMSKKMLAAIRKARYVQSIAGELLELRSEGALPDITPRTTKDDPETVAADERKALGIELDRRPKGENVDKFVSATYLDLKGKIESRNIIVMQAAMDISEARGFALADRCPKVILVNSRDAPRPKLFTLLHEYAHLLLKTDGICLTSSDCDGRPKEHDMSVEKWCNDFAGAVIMPREKVLGELNDMADRRPDGVAASMSSKFCASKMAAVVRILNLLDVDPRREEYVEYHRRIQSGQTTPASGGGGKEGRNMAKECIDHNGARYVRLVCDSGNQGLITFSDMIKYLDLKTKHFEKLNALI